MVGYFLTVLVFALADIPIQKAIVLSDRAMKHERIRPVLAKAAELKQRARTHLTEIKTELREYRIVQEFEKAQLAFEDYCEGCYGVWLWCFPSLEFAFIRLVYLSWAYLFYGTMWTFYGDLITDLAYFWLAKIGAGVIVFTCLVPLLYRIILGCCWVVLAIPCYTYKLICLALCRFEKRYTLPEQFYIALCALTALDPALPGIWGPHPFLVVFLIMWG